MSEILGVTLGLAAVSYLFLYGAFKMRDSDVSVNQAISVLLAFFGLVFINILTFVVMRVVQNTASLSYLDTRVIVVGLLVVISASMLLSFILLLSIIIGSVVVLWNWYKGILTRRRYE